MYFDQYFRKLVVRLCARVYAHFAFSPSGLWISKKFCWGLLCVISGMICMTLIVFGTALASVPLKIGDDDR